MAKPSTHIHPKGDSNIIPGSQVDAKKHEELFSILQGDAFFLFFEFTNLNGIEPTTVLKNAMLLIHWAAFYEAEKILDYLISLGPDVLLAKTRFGQTAYDFAKKKVRDKLDKAFREATPTEEKDKQTQKDHIIKVDKKLKEREKAKATEGLQNIIDAAKAELKLKKEPSKMGLFCIFASRGNLIAFKAMIDMGLDPATPVEKGATALHYAAQKDQTNIVEFLIQYAKDKNRPDIITAKTEGQKTALELAGPKASKLLGEITKLELDQKAAREKVDLKQFNLAKARMKEEVESHPSNQETVMLPMNINTDDILKQLMSAESNAKPEDLAEMAAESAAANASAATVSAPGPNTSNKNKK